MILHNHPEDRVCFKFFFSSSFHSLSSLCLHSFSFLSPLGRPYALGFAALAEKFDGVSGRGKAFGRCFRSKGSACVFDGRSTSRRKRLRSGWGPKEDEQNDSTSSYIIGLKPTSPQWKCNITWGPHLPVIFCSFRTPPRAINPPHPKQLLTYLNPPPKGSYRGGIN